jgi:hypothetical protein
MSQPTLTMTDIAVLAGVQRPVVSMWRKRPTPGGQPVPFPKAVERVAGIDRFALDEVLDYLATTGRGRNAQAVLDAPALAAPESMAFDDLVVLLVLRHLVGEDLSGENLARLAAEVDPDDALLAREVRALAGASTDYIDDLYAASFGASDALDRLLATRAARLDRRRQLTPESLGLLSVVVQALLVHQGDGCAVIDASGGTSNGVLQVAEAASAEVRLDDAGDAARAARRVATLRDLAIVDIAAPGVRVDVLVGVDIDEALRRIDEMCLQLAPGELGLLLGAAALLTDRLVSSEADELRARNIRDGHLLAAARLPRRMVDGAPRQAMACWLVTGAADSDRPVAVADLGDVPLSEIDSTDMATDLVAVLRSPRGHHFRYLVGRAVVSVVAGRTVVERGTQAVLPVNVEGASGRLRAHVEALDTPLPRVRIADAVATASAPRGSATVAELRARGDLRIRSGSRLDPTWAEPDGTVEVADLDGWCGLRFDPLDLQARAPQAMRTEPGDVVVTTNPPSAVVEKRGGRLVPTPARVLRLMESSPIGPHAVAHQINQLPASARDLNSWRLDLSADSAVEQLLAALEDARKDLRRRLAHIDAVAQLVATGSPGLTIQIDPTSTDRND